MLEKAPISSNKRHVVPAICMGTLSLLFPPHCDVCGTPQSKRISPLCEECLAELNFVADDYCRSCGMPQGPGVGVIEGCSSCKDMTFGLREIAALGRYEDGLADVVRALKFGKRRALARLIGVWLAQIVLDRGISCAAVTAIPLGRKRQWKRGFNQAELIGRELAKHIERPFIGGLLRRVRNTPAQAKLDETVRQKNVRGAFEATKKARTCSSQHLLLVDDVMTTGATLREAARTLRNAGFKDISAAIFAR